MFRNSISFVLNVLLFHCIVPSQIKWIVLGNRCKNPGVMISRQGCFTRAFSRSNVLRQRHPSVMTSEQEWAGPPQVPQWPLNWYVSDKSVKRETG